MRKSAILCVLTLLSGGSSATWAATSFSDAMTSGTAHLIFRYRLENVDQDGLSRDATASTLRTRLNYKSASYNGINFFAELDDLSYIGDDDFNNTRNGKGGVYPVVADPDGTDVNQFYIDYKVEDALFRVGRQRINLDNQRFMGGVGWRQNEQTFDAATAIITGVADSVIFYSYVDNVSRIFGPDKGTPANKLNASNHVLNYKYSRDKFGTLVGYGYFLDFEDAPALSSRTVGLRYKNSFPLDSGWSIPLTLEYADQRDYGDNPSSYSANYYLLTTGVKTPVVGITFNYEVLSGNASAKGESFTTPLATLHAHQGWNDKFLNTPAAGIEDAYIKLSGNLFGTKAALIYHDFSAEDGNADYGNELDISIARKISDHWSILLKYSRYTEDGFSTDTSKTWVMVNAKF
jgi:Alginate export